MTPENFAALQDGHTELKRQVGELQAQVGELKEGLAENTAVTKETAAGNAELMVWLRAFEGAAKVLNMVGSVAKPLGYIAAFIAAGASAWYAFIHKGP